MGSFLSLTIERLLFHPVTVTAATRVGDVFCLVSMQGEGLQGVTWIPGQTIQFMVGSLTKRAYTPMDVDPQTGSAKFLFYRHGQGPGSAWADSLQEGDVCKVMRPKSSIDFPKAEGPVLFFGDETSFAAAQALQQCQPGSATSHLILEVASLADSQAVVSTLGLAQITLLEKTSDRSHLQPAARQFEQLVSTLGTPTWFFTGCAPSIQVVRKELKARGVSLNQGTVKPYWSPGRKGMD